MRYPELGYVPESEDPSLMIETERLRVFVIDNTGLLAQRVESQSYFNRGHQVTPFVHHLGYHGIRTLYDREEKRNLVVPFASWLNLQTVEMDSVEPDPVDERSWAGRGRGWPIRMEKKGRGALLRMDPLPNMGMRYELELQPAEPDGIDFSVSFTFGRVPGSGPVRFRATWPLYVNAWDDVRLFHPRGNPAGRWEWSSIGEKPDMVLGETVNYRHSQAIFHAEEQAFPLGYGLIGDHALIIMFSDPKVRMFVVNAGGHFPFSSVQNPAWDFEWTLHDYPVNERIGFRGRLIYTGFESAELVYKRYAAWKERGFECQST